jgi:hypothetical protein
MLTQAELKMLLDAGVPAQELNQPAAFEAPRPPIQLSQLQQQPARVVVPQNPNGDFPLLIPYDQSLPPLEPGQYVQQLFIDLYGEEGARRRGLVSYFASSFSSASSSFSSSSSYSSSTHRRG